MITSRDPPNLQVLLDPDPDLQYRLSLSGSPQRTLWRQYESKRQPKRYKAVMKQVVGGAFSGLFHEDAEDEIVYALLRASRKKFDASPEDEDMMLRQSIDKLTAMVKQLIGPRVNFYLQNVVSKLLDPKINLHWSSRTNNCQNFCDSLLDHEIFGPLIAQNSVKVDSIGEPLYLMSFVSRPGS